MSWISPKINWNESDHFNYTDYNRIKGNIEYLATYMSDFNITITDMGADKSVTDLVTAEELTIFPHNVYAINQQSYKFLTIKNATYTANSYAPNYAEWNRVEGAIFSLYNTYYSKASLVQHLSWRMGNVKAFGKRI